MSQPAKRRMIKTLLWTVVALAMLAVAAPYLPADVFRGSIQRAMERGLGRSVDIDRVHFTFFPGPFPGPGFALDNVIIHEDPRAGIEPFAHMDSLGASIRVRSLFRGRLEFSSLNLGSADINLVKTDAGPWNFQFLLDSPAANVGAMPAIRMRAGRMNFKFGDTKSVFYFDDADLNVSPSQDGSLDLRFWGAPSRTDRSAQEFGRFYIRGSVAPGNQRLDLQVELERSSLEETLRLIDPTGFGMHGVVALNAQLSGPPSHLDVSGQIQVDEFHSADQPPTQGGGWKLAYQGTLDMRGEHLDLQSTASNGPLVIRFRSWDFLKTPQWDAGVDLQQVPLATLLSIGQHMGASLPEDLTAEGSVSGSVTYNQQDGVRGSVAVRDASLTLPDAEPLEAPLATVEIEQGTVRLEPVSVKIGEKQSAQIEATYGLIAPRDLDFSITTKGLRVADMRSFGLAAIPIVEMTPRGTWRGSAEYSAGDWSGDSELLNARFVVGGLADPVDVESAALSLNGKRVTLNRVRAQIGKIKFTGDYRWDPAAVRPHKFNLAIADADAGELQRLLAPALVRERGFLARTLGVGAAPAPPAWLADRRAEGKVSIETLSAADLKMEGLKARLLWDASKVRLAGLTGSTGTESWSFAGDLNIDLDQAAPHYHFDGKLTDIAYKGGKLDLEGTLDAEGSGAQLFETARAEGQLRGRSIAFSPEAEFRSAAATFEMQGLRWKLSNFEGDQGGESWAGSGASQSDGRMVLDLVSRGRQTRYTGQLFAMNPQP